jgi:DHA2 family multidrug resistance protein
MNVLKKWTEFRARLSRQFPELNPDNPSFRWLVLGTVMIGTFMAVLDATIVNVALAKLMATFGVSVDMAEWILTAYLLIFGVMLPTSGWFADRFGYKRAYLAGLMLFTGGSFLCSFAWDINVLIAFRVVQGAGAGFLMPVGMAIITRECPPEKRGVALGFWSVSASASVSLGPTIGGYLIDRFSWQTIFDVNVPVGLLGIFISLVVLREFKSREIRKFDLLGFISLATFLTALLLALSNGNSAWNTGGWTSDFILTCLAFAIVGMLVFLITEISVDHPLIELALFKSMNFSLSNLVLFIFGLGMFGSNFLLPIYLQDSLGYTPLQAGLVFLPVGILLGITAPFAGIFSDKYNAKIPSVLGLLLLALTLYQYNFLSQWSEYWQIMLPLYIRGIAMGLIFSPLTTIAIAEISNRKMAQASGLINVIRQVGGSFGVAIFGSILTRRIIYHTGIYGQQVDPNSETLKQTVVYLQNFVSRVSGAAFHEAGLQAKILLGSFIHSQAFIQSVDDVFLLAAMTLVAAVIPVFFLHKRHKTPGENVEMVD